MVHLRLNKESFKITKIYLVLFNILFYTTSNIIKTKKIFFYKITSNICYEYL